MKYPRLASSTWPLATAYTYTIQLTVTRLAERHRRHSNAGLVSAARAFPSSARTNSRMKMNTHDQTTRCAITSNVSTLWSGFR